MSETRLPLLARIEQSRRAALTAGANEEHNLLAWLHQHLSGAQQIVADSVHLELSEDARAIVAEARGLL